MFGLLKKNQFDNEIQKINLLSIEQHASLRDKLNNNQIDTQKRFAELYNLFIQMNEELKQNKITIQNLQNEIQSLLKNNKLPAYKQNISAHYDSIEIEYSKIGNILKNYCKNKSNKKDSPNRFKEFDIRNEIVSYIKSTYNNLNVIDEFQYPNLSYFSIKDDKCVKKTTPRSDFVLLNNSTINSIFELKRWDSAISIDSKKLINNQVLNPSAVYSGASCVNDRALHLIALYKLCLSKRINTNIKHYYISVYEDFPLNNYPYGYIPPKKGIENPSVNFGPFNDKNLNSLEIDIDCISKEFNIDIDKNSYDYSMFKNTLKESFYNMHNAKELFTIDSINHNKNQKGFFIKTQCNVLYDDSIVNTNLSLNEFNNYSLEQLVNLPTNWRIRILEVL